MPQRILVVKLADLGDLLTATPALRALRLRYPGARIDALVTPRSAVVLSGLDSVDRIIEFDKFAFDRPSAALCSLPGAIALGRRLRAARYDAMAVFHHLTTRYGTMKYAALALASGAPIRAGIDNGRGWFLSHRAPDRGFGARHEVDYWLSVAAAMGATHQRPKLEIVISADAEASASRRWTELGLTGRNVAMVHPGSGAFSTARRWPVERFAALSDRLATELGVRVVVIAGPAPGETALARSLLGATREPGVLLSGVPTPQELAALLRRATLFVGNDSGVMHLAAAVETPVVAVFGPTNHRSWGPYPPESPRHVVVRQPLACSPCIHRGHSFGTPEGCPARTCLELVSVEMVVAAAMRVTGRRPRDGQGSGVGDTYPSEAEAVATEGLDPPAIPPESPIRIGPRQPAI